jgi:CheY-like chemotaxis protein
MDHLQHLARTLGLRVLLVDDNDAMRGLWRGILLSAVSTGLQTIDARDGAEAVHLAREHRPEVILMDVSMPRVDGFQATRRLKKDPTTAGIPVIAITGTTYTREDAVDAGCDGFVVKPFEAKKLLLEVARVIGRPLGGSPVGA